MCLAGCGLRRSIVGDDVPDRNSVLQPLTTDDGSCVAVTVSEYKGIVQRVTLSPGEIRLPIFRDENGIACIRLPHPLSSISY